MRSSSDHAPAKKFADHPRSPQLNWLCIGENNGCVYDFFKDLHQVLSLAVSRLVYPRPNWEIRRQYHPSWRLESIHQKAAAKRLARCLSSLHLSSHSSWHIIRQYEREKFWTETTRCVMMQNEEQFQVALVAGSSTVCTGACLPAGTYQVFVAS